MLSQTVYKFSMVSTQKFFKKSIFQNSWIFSLERVWPFGIHKQYDLIPHSSLRISWTGHLLRSSVVLSAIAALLFIRIYLIGRGTPTFVDSDNPAAFSPHWKTRFLTYSYLCALNVWLLLLPSQLCHDWSMGSIPLVESVADYRILASLSLLAVTLTSCTLLARRGKRACVTL